MTDGSPAYKCTTYLDCKYAVCLAYVSGQFQSMNYVCADQFMCQLMTAVL